MNVTVEEFQPWSRGRWGAAISIAVLVQLALVLAFTQRPVTTQRPVNDAHVILPENAATELQELTDPTLFALGSPRNSSATWLELPQLRPVETDWEQPPQWLALEESALGRTFLEFARANEGSLHGPAFKPAAPKVFLAKPPPAPKPVRTASSLQAADGLADRRLVNAPALPSWPANDVLRPSEVRVVVNTRGRVTSAILLSNSGSDAADQFALAQAWQLRFSAAPAESEIKPLTLGRLVFTWHTTPEASQPTHDR